MKKIISNIFSTALIALTSISTAHAQVSDVSFGKTLPSYVGTFYNWSIGIGGTLAMGMIVYAGYTYITSAGDPSKTGEAKEVIIGSLLGLALLIGARIVLNLLAIQ